MNGLNLFIVVLNWFIISMNLIIRSIKSELWLIAFTLQFRSQLVGILTQRTRRPKNVNEYAINSMRSTCFLTFLSAFSFCPCKWTSLFYGLSCTNWPIQMKKFILVSVQYVWAICDSKYPLLRVFKADFCWEVALLSLWLGNNHSYTFWTDRIPLVLWKFKLSGYDLSSQVVIISIIRMSPRQPSFKY